MANAALHKKKLKLHNQMSFMVVNCNLCAWSCAITIMD